MLKLKDYAIQFIGDVIRMGGEVTTKEQFVERLKVCEGCEFAGWVTPLPTLTVRGCQKCGCPFINKAATRRHYNWEEQKVEETKCPMSKWADVDQNFEGMAGSGMSISEKAVIIEEIFKKHL